MFIVLFDPPKLVCFGSTFFSFILALIIWKIRSKGSIRKTVVHYCGKFFFSYFCFLSNCLLFLFFFSDSNKPTSLARLLSILSKIHLRVYLSNKMNFIRVFCTIKTHFIFKSYFTKFKMKNKQYFIDIVWMGLWNHNRKVQTCRIYFFFSPFLLFCSCN